MGRASDDQALLALLGVDEQARWEDVRRAFRDAVRATHPDLHGPDPDAERRLKQLNAAWESINTPGKWAEFIVPAGVRSRRVGDGAGHRGPQEVTTLARLRVQRAQRGSAGLLRWNFELDGEVTGTIENGGVGMFDAEPGRHDLRVFYGSRSSAPLSVNLHRGQELMLGCRQIDSWRVGLFSPGRSLVLELLGNRRAGGR